MTVTLCVKKIYNTLIYITVKYYKLYDNTYIKKKKFFPFKKEFNYEKKKKEYFSNYKLMKLIISLFTKDICIPFFSFRI